MILTASCQTVNLTGGASLARIYHSQQEYYSFISLIPRIFSVILRSCHGVEHFHHPWPRIKKKKKKKLSRICSFPHACPHFSRCCHRRSHWCSCYCALLFLTCSTLYHIFTTPSTHRGYKAGWIRNRGPSWNFSIWLVDYFPTKPVTNQICNGQGLPGPVIDRGTRYAFISGYDRRMRNPAWVAEHITAESISLRNGDRKCSKFTEDQDGMPALQQPPLPKDSPAC